MIQKISFVGLGCVALLLGVILGLNLGFSATESNSAWTHIAYYLTQSGGMAGTSFGITIACILYSLQEKGWQNKLQIFGKAFLGIVLIIALFAALNEKFTKPLLKLERPSHHEMLGRLNMSPLLDSLYQLSKEERIQFFGIQTKKQPELFKNIDPQVLQHWVLEGGYSFPSGHTFNAFLLAMIFSFGILHNTHSKRLQQLYPLPLMWAAMVGISRVALGAHSLVDVCVGGLMGVGVGALLLYIDFTRHLITHQKPS
jgi:phosphatidylglycerophosphatase B